MSDIGKIIRTNALPSPDQRENNVIYQVAAPGAATYKDYAIDSNGDLKTPSYIPLTGTEEGKPLTKNIEVDPSEEGSVGLISNTPDVSEAAIVIQEDDSILAESANSSENSSSSIHIHHNDGIEISATTSDEQFSAIIDTSGLKGDNYILPTSDEHYVQKKFVTDNFTSQNNFNNTLANYYTKPETYSKAEVDAKLSAVYRPKGSVANFASLPTTGNTEGDVWNVLDTGANYVWVINLNNTGVPGWDKLSETVDLTNYVTINTEQTVEARKTFNGALDNSYAGSAIMVNGNGSSDTIYPTIGFHQPSLYAGTLSFRSDGRFHFTDIAGSDYQQIKAHGFVKDGSSDLYLLLGDGDHKPISDFATTVQLGSYHNIDTTGSIYNGSDTRSNKTWFDYNWAGTGINGSVINFSGLTGNYSTELFADYLAGDNIGFRTHNGDLGSWNTVKWLWHSGNFNPNNYVTINTDQNITSNKYFEHPYTLNMLGDEVNHTTSFNSTSGVGNIASGWLHSFYGNIWKYGMSRGGSSGADGVKFGFDFSSDAGATYSRVLSIDANSGALELKSGGNIDARGNLTLRQEFVGGSATGIWWWNTAYSERISGIGALTTDGILDYNYIGWGVSPWATTQCLAVGENTFTYKGNQVWHSDNLEDYHQYGLGAVVEVGATNMDTISQTSVLGINDGTANRPAGVGYGSVWTHRKSSTEFTQLATEIFSGQLFTRARSDAGGFTPWRKQWDSVNLPNPVNQSDLGNYLTYTGATQNVNLNTKRLLNVGNPLDYYIESIQAGGKIASYGNENNSVKTLVSSVALDSIVAGHTFDFYNTSWKAGNKRGGSANSLGFSFEFSNDGGADYNGVATIGTNGIVYSSGFNAPVFTSPNLIGGQVLYAGNSDQLYFGNPSVGAVYHEAGSLHAFSAGGNYPLYINSGGIAVNGELSINGQDVATQSWATSNFIPLTQKGVANGIATLDTNGLISTTQLPSYVDDVLEFTNLASFPATGESGKIYVALNTNKTYRWSGSSYIYITSGTVDSVNGQTGIVNLSKSDIGLSNVDNTSDATKNVLSATKWTTPRTLSYTGDVTGSASVDGSGNVNFAMSLANSGVSAGTYNSVNVDAKGRVLSGNHINYATESYVADFLQQNYFDKTVTDERFVNTEGDETINGNKTFSSSPSIPPATNGEHAVNLEQLTASLSNVVYDNDDFEILEVYRLIDSNHFDLDDTRVKKYNIVFDGASNGSVNITHLRDNQYYQFSNVSGSGADLRVGVEGYGMVDIVSSGKTAVYMSWGDGKLLKISENTNFSII